MENCKKLLDMIQRYKNILKELSEIESSMYNLETHVSSLYQSYDNKYSYNRYKNNFKKLFDYFKKIHNELANHIMNNWFEI